MKKIVMIVLIFLLYVFMVIGYFKGDTNMMILEGIPMILCYNYLLNIDKDK